MKGRLSISRINNKKDNIMLKKLTLTAMVSAALVSPSIFAQDLTVGFSSNRIRVWLASSGNQRS